MLTELSMKNFKSWKSIEKMRLAPITGLFGTNSSGKSSILQMLLLIKQSTESTDPAQAINLGDDHSPVRLGSFRDVIFGHDQHLPLKLGLKWEVPTPDNLKIFNVLSEGPELRKCEFHSSLLADSSGRVGVDGLSAFSAPFRAEVERSQRFPGMYLCRFSMESSAGRAGIPSLQADGQPAPKRFDLPPSPAVPPGEAPSPHLMVGPTLPKNILNSLFSNVFYLGPLRDRPQRTYQWRGVATIGVGYSGERAIDVMLTDRNAPDGSGNKFPTLETEVSVWLIKLGLANGAALSPLSENGDIFEIQMASGPGATTVLLPDVGFGVSQVLPVIVLCCSAPKGSTIILEQPEIHLHPAAQSGLADLFIYASKQRGVQIIFESHSEHLLRRLQRRIAEGKLAPDQTALYFCEPGGAEGSKLNPLEVDPFGNIKNWPKDFFGDEFGEMAAMAKAALERKKVPQS
ncbi:MAG: DUF3696 domain-containing protein [Phycisphaerae bacterium]